LVGSDPASRRRQGHAQFVIRARRQADWLANADSVRPRLLASFVPRNDHVIGCASGGPIGQQGSPPHTRRNANTRPRHRVSELPADLVPQTWYCAAASDAAPPFTRSTHGIAVVLQSTPLPHAGKASASASRAACSRG
jgi:hypothetical protein